MARVRAEPSAFFKFTRDKALKDETLLLLSPDRSTRLVLLAQRCGLDAQAVKRREEARAPVVNRMRDESLRVARELRERRHQEQLERERRMEERRLQEEAEEKIREEEARMRAVREAKLREEEAQKRKERLAAVSMTDDERAAVDAADEEELAAARREKQLQNERLFQARREEYAAKNKLQEAQRLAREEKLRAAEEAKQSEAEEEVEFEDTAPERQAEVVQKKIGKAATDSLLKRLSKKSAGVPQAAPRVAVPRAGVRDSAVAAELVEVVEEELDSGFAGDKQRHHREAAAKKPPAKTLPAPAGGSRAEAAAPARGLKLLRELPAVKLRSVKGAASGYADEMGRHKHERPYAEALEEFLKVPELASLHELMTQHDAAAPHIVLRTLQEKKVVLNYRQVADAASATRKFYKRSFGASSPTATDDQLQQNLVPLEQYLRSLCASGQQAPTVPLEQYFLLLAERRWGKVARKFYRALEGVVLAPSTAAALVVALCTTRTTRQRLSRPLHPLVQGARLDNAEEDLELAHRLVRQLWGELFSELKADVQERRELGLDDFSSPAPPKPAARGEVRSFCTAFRFFCQAAAAQARFRGPGKKFFEPIDQLWNELSQVLAPNTDATIGYIRKLSHSENSMDPAKSLRYAASLLRGLPPADRPEQAYRDLLRGYAPLHDLPPAEELFAELCEAEPKTLPAKTERLKTFAAMLGVYQRGKAAEGLPAAARFYAERARGLRARAAAMAGVGGDRPVDKGLQASLVLLDSKVLRGLARLQPDLLSASFDRGDLEEVGKVVMELADEVRDQRFPENGVQQPVQQLAVDLVALYAKAGDKGRAETLLAQRIEPERNDRSHQRVHRERAKNFFRTLMRSSLRAEALTRRRRAAPTASEA